MVDLSADAVDNFRWGEIRTDSRTEACHDIPVFRVFQYIWNKWPGFAHPGFDRMNRADTVFPENTVSVFRLGEDPLFSGNLTVILLK